MSVRPEEALRTKALAASGVSTLISTRWYANAAPQKAAYPLVVCDVEKSEPRGHLSGANWVIADIAVRIYGVEQSRTKGGYEVCQDIAEALRLALHSTSDTFTVSGESCRPTIFLDSQSDTPAGIVDGSDQPVYGITQIYKVSMAQ